ncbi:pentatricopeptide repeat-containing protein At2g02750 [Malania oleifera]|uniref:pentatricopeptide repeat-containing protein At2g02750 n=1 Tax=Malania oleifera TaxID=397392 RepID=UPI0025AEA5FA|nr:pentatricopeptide repeat-containing protein At2g02750 [Malania oleifera]
MLAILSLRASDIAKLVADRLYREALFLYSHLHSASFRPHYFTFPSLLKACAKLQAASQGKMLHAHLIKTGFHLHVYTATALTDMYMKLRLLDDAMKIFDEMPDRNLASINASISGFAQNGRWRYALWAFQQAGTGTFRPNSVSIAGVLPACEMVEHGVQIHCWAIKLGVEEDVYVATSIVTMYSNCGFLISAMKLFERIPRKNVVSYNALISGLLHNGVPRVVLDVFKDMRRSSSEEPTSVTLISVLSACSNLLYIRFGQQVHGIIVKINMGFDAMVGTALVDMYSKCGSWQWAYQVFKELNGCRNLITWNCMIAGMMLNSQSENAASLFEQLESEGLKPDSATWNSMISGFSQLGKGAEAFAFFKMMQSTGIVPSLKCITSLLPACSDMSNMRFGKMIHGHAIRTNISNDEFMTTSLIDMYMKRGHSVWAHRIFNQFEVRSNDPAVWNSMISGYGRNGEYESAFEIFYQMQQEGIVPNSATFSCILSVCSQSGNAEKGGEMFRMMIRDYRFCPTLAHFGCMVDLLSRSGQLHEARELIEEIPEPSSSAFAALLSGCQCHLDSELAEEMTTKLLVLEPENPTPFVILANIYARQGRWGDAEKVRRMMNDIGLKKILGWSIGVT